MFSLPRLAFSGAGHNLHQDINTGGQWLNHPHPMAIIKWACGCSIKKKIGEAPVT